MSSYIDTKFINLLSNRLPKFKKKSDTLWNFRCPHCGDSQKSSTKARGFVYQKKNDLFYKCHNCGIGQSLGNLIKFLDPNMHKEYVLEKWRWIIIGGAIVVGLIFTDARDSILDLFK